MYFSFPQKRKCKEGLYVVPLCAAYIPEAVGLAVYDQGNKLQRLRPVIIDTMPGTIGSEGHIAGRNLHNGAVVVVLSGAAVYIICLLYTSDAADE